MEKRTKDVWLGEELEAISPEEGMEMGIEFHFGRNEEFLEGGGREVFFVGGSGLADGSLKPEKPRSLKV